MCNGKQAASRDHFSHLGILEDIHLWFSTKVFFSLIKQINTDCYFQFGDRMALSPAVALAKGHIYLAEASGIIRLWRTVLWRSNFWGYNYISVCFCNVCLLIWELDWEAVL